MKKLLLILSIFLSASFYASAQSALSVKPAAAEVSVRLYPNPATTFVNFDLLKNADKGYALQIYSFLGKKMYDVNNVNQKITISLTDFNRGVYIYYLLDRTGKMVESGKFQVSK